MHRFDSQARLVFHYAAEEARRLGHQRIAPEHLLLGSLRLENHSTQTLRQMGLGLGEARQKLEDKVGRREQLPQNHIPEVSEAATSCMEAASAEARRLHAEQVGVGHVLLGILRTAELSTRQLTGGLTVAQILGELEGGLRGVMRRVLDSVRQPNPDYLGLHLEPVSEARHLEPSSEARHLEPSSEARHLEPSSEAGHLEPIQKVEVSLQLEPAMHQKLLAAAQGAGVSLEVLLTAWLKERLGA
jgi:ATP-dependent Clp protease ATP-binding subunit ClpA